VDELVALNPSLLRMDTPPDTEFDLHLPAGTASLFEEKIAAIPVSRRNSWRYHKVTPDDTLVSVAHTYSVSVAALADANQLESTSKLDGVEALIVPVSPAAAPSSHAVYYTTRRGDTLVSVADRFGISLSQLRRWNKLPASGIRIESGRRLHVAEPAIVRTSSTRGRHGKGKTGRTREVDSAEPDSGAGSHRSHAKSSSSRSAHKTGTKATSSKNAHKSTSAKHPKASARARK
jgi:membrane-bound lytic murein transglycosylase D